MISGETFSRMALAWVESTRTTTVPVGLDVKECRRRAADIIEGLRRDGCSFKLRENPNDLPDVLHAVCLEIEERSHGDTIPLTLISSTYQMVLAADWPEDELGEKPEVLGHLAYLAWRASLDLPNLSECLEWEQRAGNQVLKQEAMVFLLDIAPTEWSRDLCSRFLSDPATRLQVLAFLRRHLERAPGPTLQRARVIYDWLNERGSREGTTEDRLLLGWFGWLAAAASFRCGALADSLAWVKRAEQEIDTSVGSRELAERLKFLRLTLKYETHFYGEVVSGVPQLLQNATRLGIEDLEAKAQFLLAMTLKELSCDDEALHCFQCLLTNRYVLREPWLSGLIQLGLAELEGRAGCFESALARVSQVRPLLEQQDIPICSAHLHGILGELYRDHGDLDAACEAYLQAAEVYSDAQIPKNAAYMRIVLAETLMAAGRAQEAALQIMISLPVIEKGALVREAVVALALLRESLRRQRTDPIAVRVLREQLDRMRAEGSW